ncbi:MAG: hypothetical protein ACYSR6_11900 [Planctomycetota bacterium]
MGRKIRMVPPNWEHPRYTAENSTYRSNIGSFMPMYDKDYETAAQEWIAQFALWQEGKHEDQPCDDCKYFWEYDSPPDPDVHRPAFDKAPTWFQMYETVSEGTPCTPPFETKAELVDWLVEKGESHGTQYERRYTRAQAKAFVEQEWAPSFVVTPERGIETGVEHSETLP